MGWKDIVRYGSLAFGPAGFLAGDAATGGEWLGARPEGPTSNVPAADRNNFQLPNADQRGDFLRGGAQNAQLRQAPQAADSSFRGDQQALVDRLRAQMNGQDSLSRLQLRDATDANIAQQRSLAASASPGNAAMAQRLAMQNIGKMNQGFGSQAAQLGIQERNAAANALGAVAGQGRGQDLQRNEFNANAQLQQRGLNDQYTMGMSGLELQNAGMVQRGNMGYEQNNTQRYGIDKAVPVQPANWERVAGAAAGLTPLMMAQGGVATEPTDAVVGEAGPEAVLPLDALMRIVSAPASKVAPDDPMAAGLSALLRRRADVGEIKPHTSYGSGGPAMMATGGVVTRPTRAIIGEAGPEAVIPLDKLPDLVSRLRAHIGGQEAPESLRREALSRVHARPSRPEELQRVKPNRARKRILPGELAKAPGTYAEKE